MTPRTLAIALAAFSTLALAGWVWKASAQQPERDPPPTVTFQGKTIKLDWGEEPPDKFIEQAEVTKVWTYYNSNPEVKEQAVVLAFLGTFAPGRMYVARFYDAGGNAFDRQGNLVDSNGLDPWGNPVDPKELDHKVFSTRKTARGYEQIDVISAEEALSHTDEIDPVPRRTWMSVKLPKKTSSVALIKLIKSL